jgi:endonuclease/exonuclease/phosphatase family metal-dependent hydrolase
MITCVPDQMDAARDQFVRAAAAGALTVVTANLEHGGIALDGDDSSLRATIAAIAPLRPDIVLLQEAGARDPLQTWRLTHRLAAALGAMRPILGPPAAAGSRCGSHTAILVAAHLTVTDQWPPPPPAGPAEPWCSAELADPRLPGPLVVISAHLPIRSPAARLRAAQLIASVAAEKTRDGNLVVAGGDMNCYPRAGAPAAVDDLPLHLEITRTAPGPGGRLVPDLSADDTLTAVLPDVGAALAARGAGPHCLAPTGRGGARVDRIHADPALVATAVAYRAIVTGSDHQAIAVTFDLARLPPDGRA